MNIEAATDSRGNCLGACRGKRRYMHPCARLSGTQRHLLSVARYKWGCTLMTIFAHWRLIGCKRAFAFRNLSMEARHVHRRYCFRLLDLRRVHHCLGSVLGEQVALPSTRRLPGLASDIRARLAPVAPSCPEAA
jgi:hypothetical protein